MTFARFDAVGTRILDLNRDAAGVQRTGTYRTPAGTVLGGLERIDEPAVEQRLAVDDDKRATMDVFVASSSIPRPQIGATWTAYTDGKEWTVHRYRFVPGLTILEVERIVGTGDDT